MITRNFRNVAMFLMALITLSSCIEEQDSITESMGYGTIIEYKGSNLLVLENDYYGTNSATLRASDISTSSLSEYEEGDRVIAAYHINWNKQSDYTTSGVIDANINVARDWKTKEMVDNSHLEVPQPFASDSLKAILAPFITYNSNGNSIITTAGIMHGIAAGGSNYSLDLVRPAAYEYKSKSDTLYIVLNEGDVDTSKETSVEYKSYVLPSNLYEGNEVDLIVRFVAKSVTGNYKIGYLDKDKKEAFFRLTYKNPYFDKEDK